MGQQSGQLTYIDIAGIDVVSLTVTDIRQRLQSNAIVIICRKKQSPQVTHSTIASSTHMNSLTNHNISKSVEQLPFTVGGVFNTVPSLSSVQCLCKHNVM